MSKEYQKGDTILLKENGHYLKVQFETDFKSIIFTRDGVILGFHKIDYSSSLDYSNLKTNSGNLHIGPKKSNHRYVIEAKNTSNSTTGLDINLTDLNTAIHHLIGTDDVRTIAGQPPTFDFLLSDANGGLNIKYKNGSIFFEY